MFHVGMVGSQCYLMAHQQGSSTVSAACLTLTSRAVTNVLQGSASEEADAMLADTPAHAMLSFFYHIFEKFPGRTAFGVPVSPTHVFFLLPDAADEAHAEGLLQYAAQLWDGLLDQTKKDFKGVVFDFAAHHGCSMPPLAEPGTALMGAWLAQAISRVPIQLCRVEV